MHAIRCIGFEQARRIHVRVFRRAEGIRRLARERYEKLMANLTDTRQLQTRYCLRPILGVCAPTD